MNRRMFYCLALSGALLAASCSHSEPAQSERVPESSAPPVVEAPVVEESGATDSANDTKPADNGMRLVRGDWQIQDDRITSPEDQWAVLQLPIRPPAEYVVSLRAKRLTQDRALVIGLPTGGQQVLLVLDHVSIFSGLEQVDGKYLNENDSVYRNWLFAPDQEAKIVCTVSHEGVTCTFNAKTIVNWRGDLKRLSLPRGYTLPDPSALFLETPRKPIRDSGSHCVPLYAVAKLLVGTPTVPEAAIDEVRPGDEQQRSTVPTPFRRAWARRNGDGPVPESFHNVLFRREMKYGLTLILKSNARGIPARQPSEYWPTKNSATTTRGGT